MEICSYLMSKFISSDGDFKVRNESKKCEQNHTTRTLLVLAADAKIVTADIIVLTLGWIWILFRHTRPGGHLLNTHGS